MVREMKAIFGFLWSNIYIKNSMKEKQKSMRIYTLSQ